MSGVLNSRGFRAIALLIALNLILNSVALAIEPAAKSLGELVGQLQGPPRAAHYSGTPTQPRLGENPGRSRGRGMWNSSERRSILREAVSRRIVRRGGLESLTLVEFSGQPDGPGASCIVPSSGIVASADALELLYALQGDDDNAGSGGGGVPGEGGHNNGGQGNGSGAGPGAGGGGGPSGGGGGGVGGPGSGQGPGASGPTAGTTNTHTGNKLTAVPIVSWPSRGDLGVSFTLYHNSLGNLASEFGDLWSHSYNMWIEVVSGNRVLHFPDGTVMPFVASGGEYLPDFPRWGRIVALSGSEHDYYNHHQIKYHFNSSGDLVSITDRSSNTITINRDGSGNITSVVDGAGSRTLSFHYSGGKVDYITDPTSRRWDFTYASENGIEEIEFPEIDETDYTLFFDYDANDNITTLTDRRGNDWTYEYDSSDRITKEYYPTTGGSPPANMKKYVYGSTYTDIELPSSLPLSRHYYRHNFSSGNLVSVVDPAGFSVGYTYDSHHNISKITDQRGKEWEFTYDSRGNRLTSENPYNKVWEYTYNSSNDLLTVEDPYAKTVTIARLSNGKVDTVTNQLSDVVVDYGYDSYGQVTSVKDAYNRETTIAYETNGDVDEVDSPASGVTDYGYNSLGQVTSVTNDDSVTTEIEYDDWSRPVRLVHPDDSYVELTYDPEDNVTNVRDENGRTSETTYDNAGHVISFENARGDTEYYYWEANTWLWKVKNGRGYDRIYERGLRGDIVGLTMPDSSEEQWTYNGCGDVTKYTSPLTGGSAYDIDYVYDDAGRLTTVDYDSGTDTSFIYDDAGRRTQMVDSSGTTAWTYNDASQVTHFDSPQGDVDYEYWDDGQIKKADDDASGDFTYAYSSTTGQLTSLTNPYSEVTSFTYDNLGRLKRETVHSGQYTLYGYDDRDRLISLDHKKSDNSVISAEDYEYDDADNLIEKTVDSVVTTYEYDYIDQLLSESRTGYSASYTYDANGNRASKTLGSTTETYTNDSGDKLTEIKVGSTTIKSFVYDTAGRRKEMTDSGGTTYYAYDFESRLTSVTRSGITTNTFAYNGLDTRISRVDSTGTSTFKRMGADVTDPVLGDGAAVYTPGVSERRSSTTSYVMSDFLGSHTAQASTSQVVTATQSFDAFGNLLSSTGSPSSPFGFAGSWGYQTDANHGLQLLGHRYYDPSVGRFLTRDAAYDGRNWYGYCENNPLKWIDPNGYQHGPPIPVPGGGKGNGWKWNPNPRNSRGGTWGPKYPIPGQSQPSASWEPGKSGGPGHWDVDDGLGNRQRFDGRGHPITPEQAHNPPKGGPAPGSLSKWLRLGFILGFILLPANEGAPSCVDMIHHPGFCPICGHYISPRKKSPKPATRIGHA